MVHHHHEHGCNLHPAAPITLQRALARDHLRDILRAEPRALPPLHVHILPALYPLPANLPGRASTSASESIPSDFPRGPCDADQYDRFGMCAGLGRGDGGVCVGIMVD